jgi:hypothetical protein
MNWNVWKPRLIRHGSCLLLGWVIGPYFAAWTVEASVGMGARGDFTWLDPFWRILLIAAFELTWFYASRRKTIFSALPR